MVDTIFKTKGETFSRADGDNNMDMESVLHADGDDSIDMESVLHGSENEIEDENQLNLPETIDSLKTSSNLKKKSKNKKSGKNLQEKKYQVLEKFGKSLMEEDKDEAHDVFGKMVASEMKSMSAHMKFRFKHDVNNLIFKYQELQYSEVRNFEGVSSQTAGDAWYSSFNTYMVNS